MCLYHFIAAMKKEKESMYTIYYTYIKRIIIYIRSSKPFLLPTIFNRNDVYVFISILWPLVEVIESIKIDKEYHN